MIGRLVVVLLAVLLQIGVSVGSFATSADAQEVTACTVESGTVILVPGWSPTGPPKMQRITIGGTLGGCTGAVLSGTVVAHLISAFSEDCATLAEPTRARGSGKVEWAGGTISKLGSDFGMFESGMSAKFTGTVTAGQFQGRVMLATLTLTPLDGNCTTTSVRQLSFAGTVRVR